MLTRKQIDEAVEDKNSMHTLAERLTKILAKVTADSIEEQTDVNIKAGHFETTILDDGSKSTSITVKVDRLEFLTKDQFEKFHAELDMEDMDIYGVIDDSALIMLRDQLIKEGNPTGNSSGTLSDLLPMVSSKEYTKELKNLVYELLDEYYKQGMDINLHIKSSGGKSLTTINRKGRH